MTSVWATHAQVVFNYYLQFKKAENMQMQPALVLDKIVSFMDIYICVQSCRTPSSSTSSVI